MAGKFQFTKGMEVEICSDDQGLRGAWFCGKILQSIPRKKKALVEYHTLNTSEEEGSKPLKEFVKLINIRPIPPREVDSRFNFSDEVDAYHNDGWWEGIVTRVIEKEKGNFFRYLVYFRTGKEEIEFGEDELRIHREWVHGVWVPPLEEMVKAQAKAKACEDDKGRSCGAVIEDVDDLQQQQKLETVVLHKDTFSPNENIVDIKSIDGDCNQIGNRSDKTKLPLVSNIDDIARTTSIAVNEAILSNGSGPCSDPVASRWQLNNLDDLSCSNPTTNNATDADTLEEAMEQPTSERNDTEISSPCEKLNEVEMMEGSLVLIAQVEQATPSTLSPEVEDTDCQNKKEITQNMSAIILSPSQQLNDHLTPNSGQGETGIVTDYDISKCQSTIIVTMLPINNEEPCNSETHVQSLEQNHIVHAVDRQDQQPCLEAGWLCSETSVDGNEHPEKSSLPEPKVDKEKKKRPPSQTSCPNNLIEERKKRPSQQCPKLPEPFIPSDEQQQCRRTGKGWRCSTMAFPRKRYCEKHEIEQNVRNQKRRKRPELTVGTMEPFQPSDPQQCRRSGKGWRCRAMALSGKRYCDKHQLEQNVHNEKRREKRKLVKEPCLALEMDMNGLPNQGDAGDMLQIENTVECIVNMQCEVGRSDSGNVAMSSEVDPERNEQMDMEPIQGETGVVSVDISNESETKKRMTGAFFDEFWPVFIT